MHNFEDIIEKYKRELVDFSKQMSVHTVIEEEYREAVSTAAQLNATEAVTDIDEPEVVIASPLPFADYEEFMANNPSTGVLRVQTFAANRSFPVQGASVRVYVKFTNGERELFTGTTDENGIIDGIRLPAPDSSVSFDENSTVAPYAIYSMTVTKPGYASAYFDGIPVFDSVKSIQPVELVPLSTNGRAPTPEVVGNESSTLFGGAV